jgi:hypothetical protein
MIDKIAPFLLPFQHILLPVLKPFFKLKEIYFKIILKKQVSLAKSRHAISIWVL